MIGPYVRRLRLATELRRLRGEPGLTHDLLSKAATELPGQQRGPGNG